MRAWLAKGLILPMERKICWKYRHTGWHIFSSRIPLTCSSFFWKTCFREVSPCSSKPSSLWLENWKSSSLWQVLSQCLLCGYLPQKNAHRQVFNSLHDYYFSWRFLLKSFYVQQIRWKISVMLDKAISFHLSVIVSLFFFMGKVCICVSLCGCVFVLYHILKQQCKMAWYFVP